MTIEKNNWNRWKKTAGSFDMEEIQMALRNYNTREENEMQDLTQKQIDLAGFSKKGFSQEQINQIYEYAQMVGDELKVRNLIWSIAGANDQSDQERIVQLMDDARKEIEIYPDSEVTMSALHGYGYLADDMYPLSKEAALDLHMRGLKIYCLQTDGTKSKYASREMIQEHEGLFGVEKRVWDALEEDEPVYTEDIEPLHDPMTVIDKGTALKYYDAGATIYLITPFSQLIAASERMEIERGADHFQLSVYEQTLLQDLETEMENHPQLQSLKEARLLLGNEHRYGIYQFKEGSFAETYAFMNMNYIMDHNITIHKEDYNLVYSAEMLPSDSLDGLYERFNIDRPRDFTGHSMTVGDIIVVNDEGNLTAYFVDSISFKELDQFINLEKVLPEKESEIPQKEEYKPLTKVEELEEQNYNMVDNVLNNGFGEKERREEIRKAAESYQQKTGATITFFAAVCEEFPSMGNYFDGLTVEQVTDRYKQILADPRLSYMGNGMGFELHDSSLPDYLDGPMTLIKGHTIYADNIDSISYYREHPLVLEAIQELRERFPDFKYFMTAQEKQDIYPEHMTAEAIAYALVDLAEDFDTYEFRDNVDDKETLVKEIEYDLYAGRGKKEYSGFLKDVMDESDELSAKAQVLLQRINDYSIPEKKDLEPMVKIVFSEYREMETGKYLPFKEANEKLGALDQTFLKENQANDKWDDLYSVGYMVLCSIDSEIHKVTGKIMLGTGEGDIIEHMKGIEDQRDVQEHILPYLYEYCGLVEKSPDIATEVNEKESAANHKEVQSEAVTVKSSDRSAGEKKKSIHDRLKENKEKLGQKSGKDNPQKGVELT